MNVPHTLIGGTPPHLTANKTSFCLDWIAATYKEVSPPSELPDPIRITDEERPVPRRGYNNAAALRPAGRVDWHSFRHDQGIGYEWRGNCMKHLREAGISDEVWPAILTGANWQPTRIDFAIDVRVDGAHPLQLREALNAGEAKTSARTVDYYERDRGGEGATLYCGTRNSDRMLRVYDKAGREGVPGPWVRIEVQMMKKFARPMLAQACTWGLRQAGAAQIRSLLNCEAVEWYRDAIGDLVIGAAEPDRSKPDEDKYLRWVRDTVLPGIRDRILDGRVDGLNELIQTWYNDLSLWLQPS